MRRFMLAAEQETPPEKEGQDRQQGNLNPEGQMEREEG